MATPKSNKSKPPAARPTDGELEILAVLWDLGACTVRQVHDVITQTRDISYTTTLKLLQIMHEKGAVVRDDARKPHIYQAVASEALTQKRLVSDLLRRAFGGSAEKLVAALTATRIAPAEMKQIRELLDHAENRDTATDGAAGFATNSAAGADDAGENQTENEPENQAAKEDQ